MSSSPRRVLLFVVAGLLAISSIAFHVFRSCHACIDVLIIISYVDLLIFICLCLSYDDHSGY